MATTNPALETASARFGAAVNRKLIGCVRGAMGVLGHIFGFVIAALMTISAGLEMYAERTRKANGELTGAGKAAQAASTGVSLAAKAFLIAEGVTTGLTIAVAALAAEVCVGMCVGTVRRAVRERA